MQLELPRVRPADFACDVDVAVASVKSQQAKGETMFDALKDEELEHIWGALTDQERALWTALLAYENLRKLLSPFTKLPPLALDFTPSGSSLPKP